MPVDEDTIWRCYSMTKPITGVALMSLYERGLFQLSDPVHRFLPEWRDVLVRERGDDGTSEPGLAHRAMTVRDLLMHMSGIGYGPKRGAPRHQRAHSGAAAADRLDGRRRSPTLSELLAAEPLRFHPGEHWLYSWSTDMCARLRRGALRPAVRRVPARTTIFEPLGMIDTGFSVPDSEIKRFAACYRPRRARSASCSSTIRSRAAVASSRRCSRAAADSSARPTTTSASASMLLGGGELDGGACSAARPSS